MKIRCYSPASQAFGEWKYSHDDSFSDQATWTEELYLEGLACGIEVADGMIDQNNWLGIQGLRI